MDERIRQLVRQAGLDDAEFPIKDWDNVPLAKFAELIVHECVDIVDNAVTHREPASTYVNKIKKHFGVKE